VSTRERYVVECTRADGVAVVCEAIFDVLGDSVTTLRVDAYSDFTDQMPPDIRAAEERLRRRGFIRADGDPGRSIVIERSDETGWAIARAYAPWSIRTALFDAGDVNLATLDDGGHSATVDITAEQATLLSLALEQVAEVVPFHDDLLEFR
jgi:hypothetical protein